MDGVQPIGPKLAEGRDSEIFEHGAGRVLRVARDGRSLIAEADIMRYVRSHGYPCPEVYDAGDGYLIMDRLEGPTMMEMAGKPPFPLRRSGRPGGTPPPAPLDSGAAGHPRRSAARRPAAAPRPPPTERDDHTGRTRGHRLVQRLGR
jgi:hypothetical protein